MTPEDKGLVRALVHEAAGMLRSDDRESKLEDAKRNLQLADKILGGDATDEDRALVTEIVPEQVRNLYL